MMARGIMTFRWTLQVGAFCEATSDLACCELCDLPFWGCSGYPLSPARSRSPASSPGRQSPLARSPRSSDRGSGQASAVDPDLLDTLGVFQQAADRKAESPRCVRSFSISPSGTASVTDMSANRSVASRRSVLSQVVRKPRAFHPNSEFRVMLDLTYFFAGELPCNL